MVSPPPAERLAVRVALGVPLALLGGAYIAQYFFGLFPCEMCWWQRYPHFVAIALAGLALVLPQRRKLLALAALAIAVSGVNGAFHAGVEYGWWAGLTACSSTIGENAGGDPLRSILEAPLTRCDVAPWTLAGISLAGWNFLFSFAGVLTVVLLLTRRDKATP